MARILIADDALLIRTVLRRVLTQAGHEVVGEAASGEEAVRLFVRHAPDVVVLDISMPGMDGLGALRTIVGSARAARIVMCSVLSEERHVFEALEWGARGFVTKPVRAPQLLETVDAALRS
jgi:two-component system chemotaxis response regulator CheY